MSAWSGAGPEQEHATLPRVSVPRSAGGDTAPRLVSSQRHGAASVDSAVHVSCHAGVHQLETHREADETASGRHLSQSTLYESQQTGGSRNECLII